MSRTIILRTQKFSFEYYFEAETQVIRTGKHTTIQSSSRTTHWLWLLPRKHKFEFYFASFQKTTSNSLLQAKFLHMENHARHSNRAIRIKWMPFVIFYACAGEFLCQQWLLTVRAHDPTCTSPLTCTALQGCSSASSHSASLLVGSFERA